MSKTVENPLPKEDKIREIGGRKLFFLNKGTFGRRVLHAWFAVGLRLFFRRIETSGSERVPPQGAIIFVLNHPSGLVDPALVFTALPRRVSFLAKSTLFKTFFVGTLIRQIEALPVYRQVDAAGDSSKNLQTFLNCYSMLSRGRCIALFPEGISHDESKLQKIKTGAARIALGALAVGDKSSLSKDLPRRYSEIETAEAISKFGLKIMAVGLFYTSKTSFRSEALIRFGEIFEVEKVELDEHGEPPRPAVRALTEKIERALHNVTINTETNEDMQNVFRAEALFSSVYKNLLFRRTLTDNFLKLQEMAQKFRLLDSENPQRVRELQLKIETYENAVKQSGVSVETLSLVQHPTRYVWKFLILRILFLFAVSPLAVVGAVIHLPAFFLSSFFGWLVKNHGVDSVGSSAKVLAACLFVPPTWLAVFVAVGIYFSWLWALILMPVVVISGYIALLAYEELIDLFAWVRAAWLLFNERALFLRLLVQRQILQKEIEQSLMQSEIK